MIIFYIFDPLSSCVKINFCYFIELINTKQYENTLPFLSLLISARNQTIYIFPWNYLF